jgi:hypothetical protein
MKDFWKFLGVFGSISSIIGIALAIHFFNLTKEIREPFFFDYPVKTKLIESKFLNDAPFKIFRLNGEEIKRDVSSSTFYFWNQGKKPIRTEDILDSLIVSLYDSSEILKFEVLGQSREVCKFNLVQINKHQLKLDFNIVEQFDGCVAQIIYIGDANQKLQIKGNIEGVKVFNSTTHKNETLIRILFSLLSGCILLLFAVIIAATFIKYIDKDHDFTYALMFHMLFKRGIKKSWKSYLIFLTFVALSFFYMTIRNIPSKNIENMVPSEIRKVLY